MPKTTELEIHIKCLHFDTISCTKDILRSLSRSGLKHDEHKVFDLCSANNTQNIRTGKVLPNRRAFCSHFEHDPECRSSVRPITVISQRDSTSQPSQNRFPGTDTNATNQIYKRVPQTYHGDPHRYHNALVRVRHGRKFYETSRY